MERVSFLEIGGLWRRGDVKNQQKKMLKSDSRFEEAVFFLSFFPFS